MGNTHVPHLSAATLLTTALVAAALLGCSAAVKEPDTAPTFQGEVSNQSYTVGVEITALTLPAATGGNGALTYSLEPKVGGLTFDPGSRMLTGTPTAVGSHPMTYRVVDDDDNTADSDGAVLTFTVAVQEATPPDTTDTAPTFEDTVSDQSYTVGVEITALTLPAATGGNGALTYSLQPDVGGLTFDPGSRTLTGTPTAAGSHQMTYRVVDDDDNTAAGDAAELTFTITVQEATPPDTTPPDTTDTAPTFEDTVSDQSYTVGVEITELTLPAATGGNGALTYSLEPKVGGLTFDAGARTLSGTPTATGSHQMTYRVVDDDDNTAAGDADVLMFTITVQEGDTAPTFEDTVPDQSYTVGVEITELTLPAATGGNGALTYSLEPKVGGLTFDPGSRTLTGTPTAAGSHPMTYRVEDDDDNTAAGDAAELTFTITVQATEAGKVWRQVRTGGGFPDHNGNLGRDLRDVVFGDGRFVAVGDYGTIVHSSDGRTWQTADGTVTDENLLGVAYGTGRFVAVGVHGTIVHSSDGDTWRQATNSATDDWLYGVTYGNGRFVAVGGPGVVVYSSDGDTWQATNTATDEWLLSVTYGTGRFVAVGINGAIVHSSDGDIWQRATNTATDDWHFGVTYGNGRFVAVGHNGAVVHSSDGDTWQSSSATFKDLFGVTFSVNGGFVAVGHNGAIVYSADGSTWYTRTLEDGPTFWGVAFGDQNIVAVGDRSSITVGDLTGGIQQVAPDRPVLSPLLGVTWGAGRFVAVADCGAIEYSSNGDYWQEAIEIDECLYDVTWGAGRFVAVGYDGGFTSRAGRSWSPLSDLPARDSDTGRNEEPLQAVTFGDGRFVAVGGRGGRGTIFHSNDGLSWQETAGTVSERGLAGVAFGGGRFVAVGSGGTILHSADGIEWQHALRLTSEHLDAVAFGGGRFVAVGYRGIIVHSADGNEWQHALGSDTDDRIYGVTWGAGRFVAVGGRGTIVHSVDGERWQTATADRSPDLRDVSWSGERFVAVGNAGTVIVSPPR